MNHAKILEKVKQLGFIPPPTNEERRNPHTEITRDLVPEAVALYDFITTRKLVCGKDYTRELWNSARYSFCIQWPDEYYDLID